MRAKGSLAVLVVGYVLIQFAAGVPRSTLAPPLPAGATAPGWSSRGASALGFDRLSPGGLTLASLGILAALVAAYVVLLSEARRGRVRAVAVAVAIAASLTAAALGPLVLSRDAHSYLAYGRILAVHHANPYERPPADFPGDPFTRVVSREWLDTRSVYGPLFTLISGGIAGAWAESPAAAILALKVLAALAMAGATVLAAVACRAIRPTRSTFAAAAIGLNPVLVVHTVGGGHNDALVALGIVGALALAAPTIASATPRGGRDVLATGALALTTMVKVTAAIPSALWIAAVVRAAPPGRRIRTLAAHVGVFAAVAVAASGATFGGVASLSALANLASRRGWASPARLVARGAEAVGRSIAGSAAAKPLGAIVFGLFLLPAAALLWREIRRGTLGAAPNAWGGGLLLFALGAPYLLPWYAAWFVVLLPFLTDERLTAIGVAVSCVLALTGIPAEPAPAPHLWNAMLLAVHYVTAPVMLAAFAVAARRLLRRPARQGPT